MTEYDYQVGDRIRYIGDNESKGWEGTVILAYDGNIEAVRWDNGSSTRTCPVEWNVEKIKDEPVSVRSQVLRKADEIVSKDRNSSYGEPEDNFARIAEFWNTFLAPKLKTKLTSGDTAVLMILVKLAREMNAPSLDNKIDIAGYAACLAQIDHPEGLDNVPGV